MTQSLVGGLSQWPGTWLTGTAQQTWWMGEGRVLEQCLLLIHDSQPSRHCLALHPLGGTSQLASGLGLSCLQTASAPEQSFSNLQSGHKSPARSDSAGLGLEILHFYKLLSNVHPAGRRGTLWSRRLSLGTAAPLPSPGFHSALTPLFPTKHTVKPHCVTGGEQ